MPKRKPADTFSSGLVCPVCHKRVEHTTLVSMRGPSQSRETICDKCSDQLAAENGFRQRGTRDYRHFYEQEPVPPQVIIDRARKYRITSARYENMMVEQNHRCAICLHKPPRLVDLVIDHNHETGKVRGLLCNNCNTALGFLQDSPDVVAAAFAYLKDRGCYGKDSTVEEPA